MNMNTTIFKRFFVLILVIIAFLMVIYKNETRHLMEFPSMTIFRGNIKNISLNYSARYDDLSIEDHWTYNCSENRCIRKFHNTKEIQRVTFLSCSMVCGTNFKIWPKPSNTIIKNSFGKFQLSDIQYQIITKFENVAKLMNKAMGIFISDLKQIVSSYGGRSANEDDGTNITHSVRTTINVSIYVTESDSTLLSLSTDECYTLSISYEHDTIEISITGKSFFGARHGLETLQQLMWYDDSVESLKVLTSVTIDDCPHFNYRGLMLDTSRHYFSVDTIKRIISGMSHAKLNRFHWHLTDSQSFPFVSKKFPELSIFGAYSSKEVYTHDDIKNVVDFAEARGIQIIPEIDAPAHAGNGWQWGKEKGLGDLSLCINEQPWKSYCGEPSCGQLNPKNNNTFLILESLYEELLQLTKSTDIVHMGGDEVNFDCWKQYFKNEDLNSLWCEFMIEAHKRMIKANKNQSIKYATIWNSDWSKIKCLPAEKFTLQVWLSQPSQIQQFLKSNYNLIISHVDAWYLDCGFGSWRNTIGQGTCPPYKAWYTLYNYQPWNTMNLMDDQKKRILGGEACMWTEQVNEDSIDTRIWPRAAAFAERLWSNPQTLVIPKETVNRFSIFQKRFQALGLKTDAIFPKYCEQNEEECI